MGVRVLGRPALVGPAGVTEIRGERQVGLLALLVAHRGRPVRRELLEEELWAGATVSEATLRVNIRRLRERFLTVTGSDPVVGTPGGYVLELPDDEVDETCFSRLVAAASEARSDGDMRACVDLASRGAALWSGDAFDGAFELPSVRPEHVRLEHLRLEARELLAVGLIELGDLSRAVDVLVSVIDLDPYRESAWALRVVALYRAGRQREALTTLEQVRRLLADDIGIGPGRALTDLERAIIDQVPIADAGAELLRPGATSRRRPVRALDPERPTVARGDAWAPAAAPPPALVGRDLLLDEAADLVAGRLGVSALVVEGPAGMGKTSVGREVARAAAARGVSVAWGTCPRDPAAGMVVVRQILADLLEGSEPASGEAAPIRSALASTFPELATDGLSAPPEPPAPAEVDAGAARVRLYGAAEKLLTTRGAPLLVVIDDAQWISESSAGLLAYLATTVAAVAWLVLARQSDQTPACAGLLDTLARNQARWHQLAPLSPDEVACLVTGRAPHEATAWSPVVAERSGGNPFLAAELIRHLEAGGDPTAVPRSVEATIAAEVGRLGSDADALVRVVAVAGTPHPTEALIDAADLDPATASAAIAALVGAGLVQTDGDRTMLWPSHDLVRGAVAGMVDAHLARRIHRALAESLAAWGPDVDHDRFRHLLVAATGTAGADGAALDEVAVRLFRRLGAESSLADVVLLGEQYLAQAEAAPVTRAGIEARLLVAAAHFATGDAVAAERLMAATRPHLRALDDAALSADAILTRSSFALTVPEADAWATDGEAVLDRLPSDERRRRVELACWLGHHRVRAGHTAAARRLSLLADASLDVLSAPAQRAGVLGLRYQVAIAVDAPAGDSDLVFAEMTDLAESSADPTAVASLRLTGFDHTLRTGTMGDYEAALRAAEDLPLPFRRAEVRWWVASARATLDLARGDLDAAATSYLQALAVGGELGIGTAVSIGLLHRMLLDWEQGTLGAFHALLPAEPVADNPALLIAQGLVSVEAGDLPGATAVADRLAAGPHVLAEAGPNVWPLLASVGAEIAWPTGHRPLAAELLDPLRAHAGRGLSLAGFGYLGAADRVLGLAAATLGDHTTAVEHLRRAVDDDRRRGAPRWAARSARAAAEVLEHRARPGDCAEAAALRTVAADLLPRPT